MPGGAAKTAREAQVGKADQGREIGPLLPGGGANLRTLTSLGGGSRGGLRPPSKKCTPLGGSDRWVAQRADRAVRCRDCIPLLDPAQQIPLRVCDSPGIRGGGGLPRAPVGSLPPLPVECIARAGCNTACVAGVTPSFASPSFASPLTGVCTYGDSCAVGPGKENT